MVRAMVQRSRPEDQGQPDRKKKGKRNKANDTSKRGTHQNEPKMLRPIHTKDQGCTIPGDEPPHLAHPGNRNAETPRHSKTTVPPRASPWCSLVFAKPLACQMWCGRLGAALPNPDSHKSPLRSPTDTPALSKTRPTDQQPAQPTAAPTARGLNPRTERVTGGETQACCCPNNSQQTSSPPEGTHGFKPARLSGVPTARPKHPI